MLLKYRKIIEKNFLILLNKKITIYKDRNANV